jgi:voltage-gated potassium channel
MMIDEKREATPEEHARHELLKNERWELLEHINALTEKPMVFLGFVWLGLLILDFTRGLSPTLRVVTDVIWGLFVADFLMEILIAPHKVDYLKSHCLTAVSLMLPALRIFAALRALQSLRLIRLLRAARAVRSASLLRLLTSLNRGMRAVRATIGRRGIGYATGLTVIVLFAAAAGMWQFENPAALRAAGMRGVTPTSGISSYAEAVWWTSMILTTMGSEYWPKTAEGRILGFLLSVFALAVFGYITANIASYFIGKDKGETPPTPDISSLTPEIAALTAEIAALRAEVARLAGNRPTDARTVQDVHDIRPLSG